MCLFLAGMQLIVLSGNAVLGFVGWELCGLSSWLLIGFSDERPLATGNALFAFVPTASATPASCSPSASPTGGSAVPNGRRFAAACRNRSRRACWRSAWSRRRWRNRRNCRSPWIARALEGLTPSSAVFYGAVMVHAGVILLIRIEPLLLQVPDMMIALAFAGLATAVYGWLCGRVQSDVKSALVYATVMQVGLMVASCGLGWFEFAAWHLALHALWRGYQFLMAPSPVPAAGAAARLPPSLTQNATALYRRPAGLLARPSGTRAAVAADALARA